VTIDCIKGEINMDVSAAELEKRKVAWKRPAYPAERGTLFKYIKSVKTASEGCVTDE